MRNYTVINGSTSYFSNWIEKEQFRGLEFNDIVQAKDQATNTGCQFTPSGSLIVRNNHYHAIVESAHARLGGLIEDCTQENADIVIHNPTKVLLDYLIKERDSNQCELTIINQRRESLFGKQQVIPKMRQLQDDILGQEEALRELSKSLLYLSYTKRVKPYVIMLYGDSSLGKTETARRISELFYGGHRLEKHMSMFENVSYADYFFGSKPNTASLGYDLYERESNLVFLDEMDKCLSIFHSAFYTLFDGPIFLDSTYEVNIEDLVIILSANYGSLNDIQKSLGDPIFNRIDKFIQYLPFKPSTLHKLLQNEVSNQLQEIDLDIDFDYIYKVSSEKIPLNQTNARIIKRTVANSIEEYLYDAHLNDE